MIDVKSLTTSQAVCVALIRADGREFTASRCTLCNRFRVLMISTAGFRALSPKTPEMVTHCVNTSWKKMLGKDIPCPHALGAKAMMDEIARVNALP